MTEALERRQVASCRRREVIRVCALVFLERRGIIESRHELTLLDDDFTERALARLAAAAH